jgi:hypothetical protein
MPVTVPKQVVQALREGLVGAGCDWADSYMRARDEIEGPPLGFQVERASKQIDSDLTEILERVVAVLEVEGS